MGIPVARISRDGIQRCLGSHFEKLYALRNEIGGKYMGKTQVKNWERILLTVTLQS
jgi:hypothetical protein